MNRIERVSAGVKFESDVLLLLDRMASEQQRTRSFIINAIVRWYLREVAAAHETARDRQRDQLPSIQI